MQCIWTIPIMRFVELVSEIGAHRLDVFAFRRLDLFESLEGPDYVDYRCERCCRNW
jgi:hypothetical protein